MLQIIIKNQTKWIKIKCPYYAQLLTEQFYFTNAPNRPQFLNEVKHILNVNNYPKKLYFPITKERVSKFYKNISIPKNYLKYISKPKHIWTISEDFNKIRNKYKFEAAFETNNNIKRIFNSKLKYNVEKKIYINNLNDQE